MYLERYMFFLFNLFNTSAMPEDETKFQNDFMSSFFVICQNVNTTVSSEKIQCSTGTGFSEPVYHQCARLNSAHR